MNNKQEGKIVRIISNLCTVKVDDKLYDCKPRGKFYIQNKIPLVGDRVIIDTDNNYILDILERKNSLKRPMIANVDVTIIVTSVKEPDLSLLLLDKLLCLVLFNKIKPIICFSKTDLLNDEEYKEFEKIYDYYNKIGINAIKNTEVDTSSNILSFILPNNTKLLQKSHSLIYWFSRVEQGKLSSNKMNDLYRVAVNSPISEYIRILQL